MFPEKKLVLQYLVKMFGNIVLLVWECSAWREGSSSAVLELHTLLGSQWDGPGTVKVWDLPSQYFTHNCKTSGTVGSTLTFHHTSCCSTEVSPQVGSSAGT